METLLVELTALLAVTVAAMGRVEALGVPCTRLWDALRRLDRHPRRVFWGLFLLGAGGSALAAAVRGLPEPFIHDELSLLLQADTFAHGRLANPPDPHWIHFESFHIIQQPTNASKYPPAQGLLLAAGQVVFGHPAAGLWLSAGLLCALTYWMLAAWLPRPWPLLGGFVVAARFAVGSYWVQSYWGGGPAAAIGGALLYGGLRRLGERPGSWNAIVTAVGVAVLANSRPWEGLATSIPAAIAVLVWTVRRLRRDGPSLGRWLGSVILPMVAVLAASAAAMAWYNFRVTGDPWLTPYQLEHRTYASLPLFIAQDLRPAPDYRHEEMRRFHGSLNARHRPGAVWVGPVSAWGRISGTLTEYLGIGLTVTLGMLLWAVVRRPWPAFAGLVVASCLASHLVVYSSHLHYSAPITVPLLVLALEALRRLRTMRWRVRRIGPPLVLGLVLVQAVAFYPRLARAPGDNPLAWRAKIRHELESQGGEHLVLVRYTHRHVPDWDWVYNGADLDEPEVLWARHVDDASNRELIADRAERTPWLLTVDIDGEKPELEPYPEVFPSDEE